MPYFSLRHEIYFLVFNATVNFFVGNSWTLVAAITLIGLAIAFIPAAAFHYLILLREERMPLWMVVAAPVTSLSQMACVRAARRAPAAETPK